MLVHIIYNNFLTPTGNELSIGGIQTYLNELSIIVCDLGYNIVIHQRSDLYFDTIHDKVRVIGYPIKNNRHCQKRLIAEALKTINIDTDLVIFGCETNAVRKLRCKTIGIQHGVFWDKPGNPRGTKLYRIKSFIKKTAHAYLTIKRINNVDHLVCVDYNFVNWYRAQVDYPRINLFVNPNFCKIPPIPFEKPSDCINVIFARRFFEYRGTRIFAEAIHRICIEYPYVKVTLAGTGPDEEYLRNFLRGKQYRFIKYNCSESMEIHKDQHISVIPTLGSEGTSLSLLEAMAASCAPICTNVGGMTNIVINRHNGLIINPEVNQLYLALKELIVDRDLRIRLSREAYLTSKEAFNYSNWRTIWEKIILNVLNVQATV